MKSGESHCTDELASDVWQGGGGMKKRRRRRRRRRKDILIKSNNPHLAGGEKPLTFGPLLEAQTDVVLSSRRKGSCTCRK